MTLKLVVKSEASGGPAELLLRGGSHGIGRLHDNDLSIQIDCVSGYHAELKRTPEGGYVVCDLKSTNGTFLNGNRVTAPETVKPGDHLKLGNVLILVEEQTEAVVWPKPESLPGDSSKVVSLKDVFGFEIGDHFNTYPITPIRPPAATAPSGGVPVPSDPMTPPIYAPGMVAQRIQQARDAERAKHLEQDREAERAKQIEQAREAERARQLEQAREAERARQLEQAREAERVKQIEQAREAERLRQIEQAREAERLRQIEQAREAERARQIEQAREAERLKQIEQAQEAERMRQIELAKEAERARQLEQAREAERVRQVEQAREAERVRQIELAREAERARRLEEAREAERVRQLEQAREAERVRLEQAREAEQARQIEQAREAERVRRLEQAREAERAQQLQRAREAELAEVNLQEGPEPPGGTDVKSAIQSLTSQLESAMLEISRLKASMTDGSPGPVAPVGPGRDPRAGMGEETRVSAHNPPPLPGRNSENRLEFGDVGALPTHSVNHPRQRSGASRFDWRKILGMRKTREENPTRIG